MLFIVILLCLLITSVSFPITLNYTAYDRNDSTHHLRNSSETSINNLLSTLVSNISTTKNGFLIHKESTQNTNFSYYGLALCRGDMAPNDCHDCIEMASKLVTQNCMGDRAIFWMEDCMLRYSNQSLYAQLQVDPYKRMYNDINIKGDVHVWTKLLQDTLSEIINKAAVGDKSGIKYATKEAWYAPMNKYLYTLAQCTPDLSPNNCSKCLSVAESDIFSVLSKGGVVLLPSCTLRYELYQFYRILKIGQSTISPQTNVTEISKGKKNSSTRIVVVAIIVPLAAVGILIALCFCRSRRKAKNGRSLEVKNVLSDLTTAESLMFELGILEEATNNFSNDQKLGQGGFGSVYKGTLPNGQDIAVKRLSKISSQGVEEFKNEVVLIANLQHRNLVKLLGFCLAGEEKLLVYEFVPNKSLNYFLFGERKHGELDWPKRYNIIKGIARGLLYLHEDSRPRIIHRDLKAANILIDANMNPKISDFGLARIFKVEQTEDDTSRVMGTYGYMAPEYAMHGQFSSKSDVYSFGVIVLEIVSGKKISTKFNQSGDGDLLNYAWRCLFEGKPLEVMDPTLKDSYSSDEILKCIQIGLWCAQDNTNERPTMSTIVLMLNSDSTTSSIPIPQRPRSFYNSSTDSSLVTNRLSQFSGTTTSSSHSVPISDNQDTISDIYPR